MSPESAVQANPLLQILPLQAKAAHLLADGDHSGARLICKQALELLRESAPAPSPRLAYLWFGLGSVLEQTAEYEDACECAQASLSLIEMLLKENAAGSSGELIRLRSLGLLVTGLRRRGRYMEAEPYAVRHVELACAMPEEASSKDGECATAWNNLGMLCKHAGWFDRGDDAYARALQFAKRKARSEGTVATILHNIGGLAHARERFDEGEEPARRAWEIRRKLLGDEHLITLADATAWAALLDGLKRYKESRAIYEHALAVYERTLGPDHYEVAATLHNLALVENAEGDRERAIELARRSCLLKRKLLGAGHPDTALSAMNLASLLPQNENAEAAELLARALETFEKSLAPDHPHIARCRQLARRMEAWFR